MDWNKIKNKSELAYEKFIFWLWKCTNKRSLSDACFCDLVAFFDSVGIMISIIFDLFLTKKFNYMICNKHNNIYNENSFDIEFNTRPEAQDQAVYKSFQILNEELKNEKSIK